MWPDEWFQTSVSNKSVSYPIVSSAQPLSPRVLGGRRGEDLLLLTMVVVRGRSADKRVIVIIIMEMEGKARGKKEGSVGYR